MALQDSLDELAGKAVAVKNRVDLLLDQLKAEKPEDYRTLTFALRDKNLRPADLTRAVRKEYGYHSVKDQSVSEWRRKNLAEVNGL
jgi:hypothetical protein